MKRVTDDEQQMMRTANQLESYKLTDWTVADVDVAFHVPIIQRLTERTILITQHPKSQFQPFITQIKLGAPVPSSDSGLCWALSEMRKGFVRSLGLFPPHVLLHFGRFYGPCLMPHPLTRAPRRSIRLQSQE